MTVITLDNAAAEMLHVAEPVILKGPSGEVLGYFSPTVPPGSIRSPISDEEMEERRKETTGKPLSEILERLNSL